VAVVKVIRRPFTVRSQPEPSEAVECPLALRSEIGIVSRRDGSFEFRQTDRFDEGDGGVEIFESRHSTFDCLSIIRASQTAKG
jgi:hypothetical protein